MRKIYSFIKRVFEIVKTSRLETVTFKTPVIDLSFAPLHFPQLS